jgi:hypothetical protein
MKLSVVTTFHQAGYETYGKRMIETFLQTWPSDVTLYVYAENCNVTETAPNLIVKDLHQASPALVNFKNTWKDVPKANGDVSDDPIRSKRKDAGKGFKWHAVRFAHKVYSIFHCAENCDADVLMWMDADTICHSPISHAEIEKLIPHASFDEDNYGQIIIYTHLKEVDDDDVYVEMTEQDFDESE